MQHTLKKLGLRNTHGTFLPARLVYTLPTYQSSSPWCLVADFLYHFGHSLGSCDHDLHVDCEYHHKIDSNARSEHRNPPCPFRSHVFPGLTTAIITTHDNVALIRVNPSRDGPPYQLPIHNPRANVSRYLCPTPINLRAWSTPKCLDPRLAFMQ